MSDGSTQKKTRQAIGESLQIWHFGRAYEFNLISNNVPLDPAAYEVGDFQKHQVFLHCTAGTNPSWGVIQNNWNKTAKKNASATFIVDNLAAGRVQRGDALPGIDARDDKFVDVVRVVDNEKYLSKHTDTHNRNTVGIEHVNLGKIDNDKRDAIANKNSFVVIKTTIKRKYGPDKVKEETYPYYEDEQYQSMMLLLRHLCLRHRIPRRFFGETIDEVQKRYLDPSNPSAEIEADSSRVARYRGILYHRHVTKGGKPCPGFIHRNRLYRGIIDEWWLPIEFGDVPRPYFTGPFKMPEWDDSKDNHAFFRIENGELKGRTYEKTGETSELQEALVETKSYFNLNNAESYYQNTETLAGGLYPIGINKVWHGGLHFFATEENPWVYAVASGTIVAARIESNSSTEEHESYGSQRFVLLRHAIYTETEEDVGPNGEKGLGERTNYSAAPTIVYTLYMHLDSFDMSGEEKQMEKANPPWFNMWWRESDDAAKESAKLKDGEKGGVFCPDIEVAVGDVLGKAGTYRKRKMIHFEVFSKDELPKWPEEAMVAKDDNSTDDDILCDTKVLDEFLVDAYGDGLDVIDVLRAAPRLRQAKTYHYSEWALRSEKHLSGLGMSPISLEAKWKHISRFTWFDEVISFADGFGGKVAKHLKGDAADQEGRFWYYHPITFMKFANKLVHQENRVISEYEYTDTNSAVNEDGFIHQFVNWNDGSNASHEANAFYEVNADAVPIKIAQGHMGEHRGIQFYKFNTEDIACPECCQQTPPLQNTRFAHVHFARVLLDTVEHIRRQYNSKINVTSSSLCSAHAKPENCCKGISVGASAHAGGVAVDIEPNCAPRLKKSSCAKLKEVVKERVEALNERISNRSGEASEADLPLGYVGAIFEQHPANPADGIFKLHIELTKHVEDLTEPDHTPYPVNLTVRLVSITVVDDEDPIGAGDWLMSMTVNGVTKALFENKQVRSGDMLTGPGGTPLHQIDVTIDPEKDEQLNMNIAGVDFDPVRDDKLGSVSARYDQNTDPAWGIGVTKHTSSDSGSYTAVIEVISKNVQDTPFS